MGIGGDLQFPFNPDSELPAGRFLIQDIELRTRILPLFKFSSSEPEERVLGQGTAFRVDPWANCATAFHVFEDLFYLGGRDGREMLVIKDRSIVALEFEGLGYGSSPILPHQWRPMNGAYSFVKIDELPFQPRRIRNFTELLSVSLLPSTQKSKGTEFLNVDLCCWRPRVDEIVLGVGYPNLDKAEETGAAEGRPISQYMYGAYGRITDIEPLDLNRSRPWPMVRVAADWAGGMSGGPVFSAAGNVIGIISSGVDAASSCAMIFGGWNAVRNTLVTLDTQPGRFLCFGVLDPTEHLINVTTNRKDAEAIAETHNGSFVSKISFHPATGQFLRLEIGQR